MSFWEKFPGYVLLSEGKKKYAVSTREGIVLRATDREMSEWKPVPPKEAAEVLRLEETIQKAFLRRKKRRL